MVADQGVDGGGKGGSGYDTQGKSVLLSLTPTTLPKLSKWWPPPGWTVVCKAGEIRSTLFTNESGWKGTFELTD